MGCCGEKRKSLRAAAFAAGGAADQAVPDGRDAAGRVRLDAVEPTPLQGVMPSV